MNEQKNMKDTWILKETLKKKRNPVTVPDSNLTF